jgi:2-(1,2-epoxy-1,2-dihydrophenyl)acetyl-CoA isomerase
MSHAPQTAHPGHILLQTKHEGIVTLTMNRPDKLNALSGELSKALSDALEQIAGDESAHVVILTGAGRAFCSGGDLAAIGRGRESNEADELAPILRSGMQAVLKMRLMPQPVIAAVNGPAAGAGMNLALAADIRIAADVATMGQTFSRVGLYPDYGGTYFLPQLVGPAIAAELFYTAEMIDAQTALRLGIVNRVVPAAQLEAEAKSLALKIAQGPPMAIRAIKKTIFGGREDELIKALDDEAEQQLKCFYSEDCSEGVRAFFEKRPPKFQGK